MYFYRIRTASLHETINLWTIVKPYCFASDHVAHGFKSKKKHSFYPYKIVHKRGSVGLLYNNYIISVFH